MIMVFVSRRHFPEFFYNLMNEMKKIRFVFLLLCSMTAMLSCNRNEYPGFDKMDNGAYMRFHSKGNGIKPETGDFVLVDITQRIGDSLLFDSFVDYGESVSVEIMEPSFVGDMMSGLLNMREGDSATVAFRIDSLFEKALGELLPEYISPETVMYVDMKLNKVLTKKEVEEEYRKEVAIMKERDDVLLASYYSNPDYTVTDNGLIVIDIKQGNGRAVTSEDVINVNFMLSTLDGDTIIDYLEGEPFSMAYDDMALGKGFNEAVGMLKEKGEGTFVIPSSLAFDSVGVRNAILPYTSFYLVIKIDDIMTIQEYENKLDMMLEKENADNMKRLAEEPGRIADYVKSHNIAVEPTESGLYFLEQKKGDGESVFKGDIVSIHYIMYNIEDKIIESSYDSGKPMKFVLGYNEMVPGIEEAVTMMKVGGKARVIVPSQIGFGDIAIDEKLPGNSTVIFDIELVAVTR